jgi:PAS domain S-box-containing protein
MVRDDQKTKAELSRELDALRRRVAQLEQAKEKLHKSEQRYRSLTDDILDSSKVGIFILDDSFKVVWLNQALERYFGLRRKDVIGKDKRQLIRKQIKDIFEEPETFVEKVFATYDNNTYIENFECHVLADGQRENRWLEHWSQPIRSGLFAGGRIEHYTDITERKKAEQALAESEEKFRSIFDNANDIIASVTKTGKILEVNKKIEDILGYKPDELVGKNILTSGILAKKNTATIVKLFKKSVKRGRLLDIRDGRNVTEVWVNHKDGHTVLLEANSTTIKEDGKLVGYLSVIRDITERKKAEEALHESEQKYRTLVESAGESIATINKDGVFLFINRTGAERFGGKPKDYIGKTMWDLFPKKIADRQAAGVRKVIHTGKERNVVALTELQGQLRWYNTTIEPLRDDSGKVIAAMVIARDIHELKQAEEELNKYREQMAKAEQLASVGTLSASMAHELTQPLTVIRLSIQNSLAELEKTSCPDTVVEDLKEGLSEISGLISIIDRFRNFARISSERTVSKVDLKAVAERIVKLLDESAWRAKVTLQVDGMDKLPPIYSCERELEQLFFSLVENAIQAADGKKSRQVVISSVVKDEHIELRFSDNCSGIAPGNLDRIFEPFFTTKPIGRRTGLGLCVLERIVSRLGGKVRVESKLGKGSTFFVTLPIKGNES